MKTRKEFYKELIDKNLKELIKLERNGCFDYKYNNRLSSYPNARMQEVVAVLAWNGNNTEEAIDFWCKIQKKKGYFSEHSKHEQSFAATAFSTQAIYYAIEKTKIKERWKKHIKKAAEYLSKNNEFKLINQETAAALSLFCISKIFKEYRLKAEEKLNMILKTQKKYFPEKKGFDLGYNTLTLYLLARIHKLTKKKEILDSAEKFLEFFAKENFPENTRNTNWLIVAGFEYFSDKCKSGKKALDLVLEKYNIHHLPDTRHMCTDLFQYCFAYENTKTDKLPKVFNKNIIKESPSRLLNIIRPFGLHKIRRYL